jgi:hypothetical protein
MARMADFDWARANREKKMRQQGAQPTDDLLPRHPSTGTSSKPSRPKTARKTSIAKGKAPADAARTNLLRFIVESVAKGHWVSDMVPRSTTPALMREVERAGGLRAWADQQPDFEAKLSAERQRKTAKKPKGRRNRRPKG